jgi:hypothetical protein
MVYRDPPPRIFSEEEAASLLGMTKRMLAKRRYEKKIKFLKDGHFIGYTQRHLDAYCEKFDTSLPSGLAAKSGPAKPKQSRVQCKPRRINREEYNATRRQIPDSEAGKLFAALLGGDRSVHAQEDRALANGEFVQAGPKHFAGKPEEIERLQGKSGQSG